MAQVGAAARRRASSRTARSASPATSPRPARLKQQSDEAIAAYEKALADARGRAQAIANETREKQAAAAEARARRSKTELNAKLADAEKTIAATKQAAMAQCARHCRGRRARHRRAADRLGAERQAVAAAVADALKR